MNDPFDAADATYTVLVNDEGQHSLWPAFADVPAGWTAVLGPTGRTECLEHVHEHWRDLRPRSLAARLDASA